MCTSPTIRVIKHKDGSTNTYETPCGRCYDCVMQRRTQLYVRNKIEFDTHKNSYFITLTYDDENIRKLPYNELACLYEHPRTEIQLFFKRFRKKYGYCRYFYCSEYGTQTLRPHFHLLLYTMHLSRINVSEFEQLWKNGNVVVDRVTDRRVHYVTKYMDKYLQFYFSKSRYDYYHQLALEGKYTITPELERQMVISINSYTCGSRKPPLGAAYFGRFDVMDHVRTTAFREGTIPKVTYRGVTTSVPRCFLTAYFADAEREQLYDNYRKQNFSEFYIAELAEKYDIDFQEVRALKVDQSNRKIEIIKKKHELFKPDIL